MGQDRTETTDTVPEDAIAPAEVAEEEEIHPLLTVETDFVTTWNEWKELWKSKSPAIIRHGLLHYGFQVRTNTPGEYTERLLFYLQAADGHCDIWAFKKIGEHQAEMRTPFNTAKSMTAQDVYRVLSEKAFVELARNLFKNSARTSDIPSWYDDIFNVPGIFEKVLWFFRPAENEWWLRNLGRHWDKAGVHYQEARDFLLGLSRMGWDFNLVRKYDKEAREMLLGARPRLVEILAGLRQLDFLLGVENEIGENSLAKLEEIAMRQDLWLPSPSQARPWEEKRRKPVNLEEAIYGKSQAAHVLTALRVRARQAARFEQLRELAFQQREVQEQIEELAD